ncbi:pesticin C-terminus-like muramidase [Marinicellulosiphila megalodicopiae]|uniref:pesticin C-terminus-like muramidase n=1 Tax=Marinicellulosiphila megalodicopiae TaxID=2724896 RepID=UPI003BB0DC72
MASVAFQYGTLSAKTPNFWKQVTALDWTSAIKNLENFGDAYSGRRKIEAKYLKDAL